MPHPTQRLRFSGILADIVHFTNLLTYLFISRVNRLTSAVTGAQTVT